jgi:hypothetical protein
MNKRPNASFPPPNHSTLTPKVTHDKASNKVTGGKVWTPSSRVITSDTLVSLMLIISCLIFMISFISYLHRGSASDDTKSASHFMPTTSQVVEKSETGDEFTLKLSDADTKVGIDPSNTETYTVSQEVYNEFSEGSAFNKDEIQNTLYKKE